MRWASSSVLWSASSAWRRASSLWESVMEQTRWGRLPGIPLPQLQHARSPAVQVDAGAGHVARCPGDEECDHVGDFLGASDASERDVLPQVGVELLHRNARLLGFFLMLPRAYQPDGYGVHQDVLRRVLLGQGFGEREPRGARHRGR